MKAKFSVCNICVVYPEVLDAQRGGRYLQTQKLNTINFHNRACQSNCTSHLLYVRHEKTFILFINYHQSSTKR